MFFISSISPNRRLLQIVTQFLYCGYACYLDIPFRRYVKMDISGRHASLLPGVYPAKAAGRTAYPIVVSDDAGYLAKFGAGAVRIFFNLHIFDHIGDVTSKDFFYPILPYRKFIFPRLEKKVRGRSANNDRKIGALFIGTTHDEYYNRKITKDLFKINTRQEMFDFITGNISRDVLYLPAGLKEFLEDIDAGRLKNRIVILDTNVFEIPSRLWFEILLESDFFIHMCGFIQPYCHNQIESMMAGCVPVTEFSRFFVPPLVHGVNGLLFNTLGELKGILEGIASGEYLAALPSLRNSILKYYENHYSFRSFRDKLSFVLDNHITDTNYYITTGEWFERIAEKAEKND